MIAWRVGQRKWMLVIDRFDLRLDGTYRGFEDFCVLNAKRTDQKYSGSYETSILKRFQQFANSPHVYADLEKFLTLIALNCALRNGDAHLKNFGIVYDDVLGEARLAPVYDLVTTAVYLPKDSMALTLNGSTRWPTAKELQRLGETRAGGTPAQIRNILDRITEAIHSTSADVRVYTKEHPDFADIGGRMLREWGKVPAAVATPAKTPKPAATATATDGERSNRRQCACPHRAARGRTLRRTDRIPRRNEPLS